jgi:hypothetical protein
MASKNKLQYEEMKKLRGQEAQSLLDLLQEVRTPDIPNCASSDVEWDI